MRRGLCCRITAKLRHLRSRVPPGERACTQRPLQAHTHCRTRSGTADCNGIVDDGCETDLSHGSTAAGGCVESTCPTGRSKQDSVSDQDGFGNCQCGCLGGSSLCPVIVATPMRTPLCRLCRPDDNANLRRMRPHLRSPTLDRTGAVGAIYPNYALRLRRRAMRALKCDGASRDCDRNIRATDEKPICTTTRTAEPAEAPVRRVSSARNCSSASSASPCRPAPARQGRPSAKAEAPSSRSPTVASSRTNRPPGKCTDPTSTLTTAGHVTWSARAQLAERERGAATSKVLHAVQAGGCNSQRRYERWMRRTSTPIRTTAEVAATVAIPSPVKPALWRPLHGEASAIETDGGLVR